MPRLRLETRTLTLAGRDISYLIRRSQRRTLGFSIGARGLVVGAPQKVGIDTVEAVLRQHATWVLKKLDAWEAHPPPPALIPRDGLELSCLGTPLLLRLAAGRNRALWSADSRQLTLLTAPGADSCKLLEHALREKARSVFAQRLACLAPELGLAPPPFALSSARTRWGSCNAHGRLRLNWRLVFFPLPLVDYVIAHELAHVREMNHGPRFWALVERLCPDWRERRRELRRRASENSG